MHLPPSTIPNIDPPGISVMAVPDAGGGCAMASRDGFAAIGPTCFCVARACSFFGGTAAMGPSCFCCFFGGLRVQTTCPGPQGSQFWPKPLSPGGHCLHWAMLLSAEANTGTESKLHEVHCPVTVSKYWVEGHAATHWAVALSTLVHCPPMAICMRSQFTLSLSFQPT